MRCIVPTWTASSLIDALASPTVGMPSACRTSSIFEPNHLVRVAIPISDGAIPLGKPPFHQCRNEPCLRI